MTTFRFPNESPEYRRHRDALLDAEVRLRAESEAVAELRRQLPLGGQLKTNYRFERETESGGLESVAFESLFGQHHTLLLYSMMFGAEWDAPCPSCTAIVDAINVGGQAVRQSASLAVVAAATPAQLAWWGKQRNWNQLDLVSGAGNDYLLDYAGFETTDAGLVSVMNVFRKTPDGIFHTWASELLSRPMASGHPRHVDAIWPLWNLLDMTPHGRGDALVPKQNFEHRYFSENVLAKFDG